ncbi:MAG: hypothetical protein JNK87_18505 [Bryobacterales bacterium]|nr:hypothetical protein [Bryobacterales bacterium]
MNKERQRFRTALLQRHFVRLHLVVILLATILVGVIQNWQLLHWNVRPLLRYPLNVVVSYLAFVAFVRTWITYIHRERSGGEITGETATDLILQPPELPDLPDAPECDLPNDGLGILMLLLGALAVAGGYVLYTGPAILADAAFDILLASSLATAARRQQERGWAQGVFRSTAVPFAIVLAITIGMAYWMHRTCPPAMTVREAMACPTSQ